VFLTLKSAEDTATTKIPAWMPFLRGRTLDQARDVAQVEDANFHDLRAASATDADEQGMDSQALLGHTTESSHRRYLRSKKVPVAQPVPGRKTAKK